MTAAPTFDEVYQSTRALVGIVHQRELGRLDHQQLLRFDAAIGADLPEDAESRLVAHPLFLTAVLGWGAGPANTDLRPDGTEVLEIDAIPLSGLRLMGGGQDLEFHADVRAGMSIRSEFSLEGVELKQGRNGPLLLLRVLRQYRDGEGTLLVTCRETLIAR